MKHQLKLFVCTGILAFVALMPMVVTFAAGTGVGGDNIPKIENPLGEKRGDLGALLLYLVEELTKVGFYVVVVFIIYSGFLFVKASGNTTKLTEARTVFLYTVIGAAILLGAMVLARVIKGTVDQLESRNSIENIIV